MTPNGASSHMLLARMRSGVEKMEAYLAMEQARIEGESSGFRWGAFLGFLLGAFVVAVWK